MQKRDKNYKLYFADGGSTFQDYSRVGYDSCSLTCSLEPFPKGVYSRTVEIDDCFTEKEAQWIGDYATCDVVNDGKYLDDAVKERAKEMLERKKAAAENT